MRSAILLLVSTVPSMSIRIEHVVQEKDEEIRGVTLAFDEKLINRMSLGDGHVILLREFVVKTGTHEPCNVWLIDTGQDMFLWPHGITSSRA